MLEKRRTCHRVIALCSVRCGRSWPSAELIWRCLIGPFLTPADKANAAPEPAVLTGARDHLKRRSAVHVEGVSALPTSIGRQLPVLVQAARSPTHILLCMRLAEKRCTDRLGSWRNAFWSVERGNRAREASCRCKSRPAPFSRDIVARYEWPIE